MIDFVRRQTKSNKYEQGLKKVEQGRTRLKKVEQGRTKVEQG